MAENSTCSAESEGEPVSGVLPDTLSYVTSTVTGLEFNTTYWCYVSSSLNRVTKCQGPLRGRTEVAVAAGEPTNVSITSTTATSMTFSWTDGAAGIPQETYTISCTDDTSASNCSSPAGNVQSTTGISRGGQSGTVNGLTAGTPYKCWVKAVNIVGTTCSTPVTYVLEKTPVITTTNMGSTTADIAWAAGALDGSFQYIVIAVASGGSCTSSPVANSTVSSSTLTAQLTNLGLNTRYEVFVKAVSTADQSYSRCSAGQSVQTWPYAFLPKYQNSCSGCNPIIRCSIQNNLMTGCVNINMGGVDITRAASVQPITVGTAAKILVGAGNGTNPVVFRCDLDPALTTVSNCVSTSVASGSSGLNRIGGILVYKSDTKVLLTESDGANVVYACDLDMGSGAVVSSCAVTGKSGATLVLSGIKPDGITRKSNTVYVSSRDASTGGIWTCTLDENAANNADALSSCTQKNLATPVFDLYYESVSDILWGTRNLQSNGAALVSCPQGDTANCKNGVVSGETVSVESKGITSGRGYVFWVSTNVYTGTVNGDSQASSIRSQSVPAIANADEIKWYPPL